MYSMSGEIHSRHCLRLMLVVSLSHSICGVAMACQIRTVPSTLAVARRPSGLYATPCTASVCRSGGADGLAGVAVP